MTQKVRVLIVEDNPADILLIEEMLVGARTSNFAIESTARLTEAVARLARGGVDLVVLDLGLPDSQGLATFRRLQAAAPDMPVIVLSGNRDDALAMTAVREGAQDFLVKGEVGGALLARAVRYAIERRQNEEKLRQRDEELLAIYKNAPLIMLLVDEQRRIYKVNDQGAAFAACEVADLIGKGSGAALRCVHTLDDPAGCGFGPGCHGCVIRRCIDEIFATGVSLHQVELLVSREVDGRHEQVAFLLAAARLELRSRPMVLVTLLDITERRRIEEQLLHAQKLEGIGQLAGGIAHDFNNILGAVIGFAGIMQMKIAEGDPLRHFADEILAAGERGAELTRQILAFSRKQVVDLKPVRLEDVVRGLEKMLRRLLPESIDIVHDLSGEEIGILADTGQLGQVLINLVTNARDAIVGSGKIGIATERLGMDRQFVESHGYGEPGEYAVLTVTDTGRGMDEATRARVFEPFFTTKEQGKGTGLGMSVVHGIIKQHRGFINVYSEVGKGTVVRVYLPLATGAGAAGQTAPPEAPVAGGSETILVAEDDAVLRKLTRTVLGQHGYTVIDAEDGEDAVTKFAAHQDAIRLVILDGLMPKLGGIEALERIRRLSSGVKALFMSGYDDDFFSRAGLRGREAFIQKPVMPADLLRKVREVLDG